MAASATGVLSPDDLNRTDEKVLGVLAGGRVTPRFVADELDVSRTYASERLKRLVEHRHVEKVAPGLYELVDDPRSSDTYTQIGDDLDWEKLQSVFPESAERLEYVIKALEAGDELEGGLHWKTVLADTPHGSVTIEEVLGALGEAKWLLERAQEAETDD